MPTASAGHCGAAPELSKGTGGVKRGKNLFDPHFIAPGKEPAAAPGVLDAPFLFNAADRAEVVRLGARREAEQWRGQSGRLLRLAGMQLDTERAGHLEDRVERRIAVLAQRRIERGTSEAGFTGEL